MGVDVFMALVLMIRGLSDTGVSSQGVSGREKGGMELPLAGVATSPSAPDSFCMTRMGVLWNTFSPPRLQPGDRGSIRVIVLTGVSHCSVSSPLSTAIGVLVTSSLADRGSEESNVYE